MTNLKSWEGQWLHWNDEVPHLLVSVELSGLIQGQCPDNVSTKKKSTSYCKLSELQLIHDKSRGTDSKDAVFGIAVINP